MIKAIENALLAAAAKGAIASTVKSYGTVKDGANLMTAATQIRMAIDNYGGPYVMTFEGN